MLRAIFYCEFDNVVGPQILYQAPDDYLSSDVFDSISDYIIIDKPLCAKIITVCLFDQKIVGYPVCIQDDKYHRNALLFNIGFIFHKDAITSQYHPILRKLGSIMESMEKESGFLTTEESKQSLSTILPRILRDLTYHGECTIPVDKANIINLKLFPKLLDPPEVYDHQVPVAIRDIGTLMQNNGEWDLTLQQVVPHIDGIRYVKKISIEAGVEIAIVKKCMQQLLYYKCITMLDVFLYSNMYATTPRISLLAENQQLQTECAAYITKSGADPPPFAKIFALYCSVQPGLRMADFCLIYADSLKNLDIRRFVTFGFIHSFLRRVHRYPIRVDRQRSNFSANSIPSPSGTTIAGNNTNIITHSRTAAGGVLKKQAVHVDVVHRLMDGKQNTDEICCSLMMSFADLETLISKDTSCNVVYK